MDKTIKILEWLDVLERRPLMIVPDRAYFSLRAYRNGYVDGLGLAYDIPKLNLFISRWLANKIGESSSASWIFQIGYNNPNKSDDELKIITIQTLRSFFDENPDWYKVGYWNES